MELRWCNSFWFPFWSKPYTIKHLEHSMSGSRKFFTLHGGFFSSLAPTPRIFCSGAGGFTVLPPHPLQFPWFFYLGPPTRGNSISINNKTEVIYFNLLGTVIKFSHSYSWLYCGRGWKAAYFCTVKQFSTLIWSHNVRYFIVHYLWECLLGQDQSC